MKYNNTKMKTILNIKLMQIKRSLKKKSFKASFKSAGVFSKSKVIGQRVPELGGRDRKRSMTVGYSVAFTN